LRRRASGIGSAVLGRRWQFVARARCGVGREAVEQGHGFGAVGPLRPVAQGVAGAFADAPWGGLGHDAMFLVAAGCCDVVKLAGDSLGRDLFRQHARVAETSG